VAVGVDDHVADLGAEPGAAAIDLAAEHQPAADPGAHGEQHHVLAARAGAEAGLCPGGRVGVVVDHGRQPGGLVQQAAQRELAVGVVRRPAHPPARPVDQPCGADADRLHTRVPAAQLLDRRQHRREGGGVVVHGRRRHHVLDDVAVRGDHAGGDLGPADVDADRLGTAGMRRQRGVPGQRACPAARLGRLSSAALAQ
jgi:hypothetical protein